ncbi:hypothetical protein [Bacteroides sedimenti]|uniref:Transmembrane protein n=1 Tax=Bacteroides sedimenti TaxID=2136147 RepID=A0ABM8IHY3_9BACE
MNKTSAEKHLFESNHQDVVKRTNIGSLLLSFLFIVAGIVTFVFSNQLEKLSGAVTLTAMVLAAFLFLLGIYWLAWKSKTLVYEPTGSKILKRSLFFDIHAKYKLEKMMKSGTFSEDIVAAGEKGSVRLDYLVSEDNQFIAMQLFQFSTYKFTSDIPVAYFRGDKAVEVAAYFNKYN